jgi:hypothetical protein
MKKNIYIITVIFLFFLYLFLGISSALKNSPAFDEPIHVAAGYVVWKLGDYRIDPENGLLPNLTASLPLLFSDREAGITIPATSDRMWDTHDRWRLSQKILRTDKTQYEKIFFRSRIMMISTFGLLSAIALFFISLRIWGKNGALISLAVYSLSPTILANSTLSNSDMAASLFFFLTAFLFWSMLDRFNILKLFLFIFFFCLLMLSKMSALIILPILFLIAIVFFILRKRWKLRLPNKRYIISSPFNKATVIISVFILTGFFSFATIWAAYGFRYSMLPDQNGRIGLNILWEKALMKDGFPQKTIGVARKYKILPEAYLYGTAYVLRHAGLRHAFLNGKYSRQGWYSFFPLCFIYKTPLAIVILVIAGLAAPFLIYKGKYRQRRLLLLWYSAFPVITAVSYFTVAVISRINIGQRHLLPIYLPLFLIAGGASLRSGKYRHAGKGIILIILLLLINNILIYPNYLSYFSSVVGGPSNGYKHLVDSSLDWGQDLNALKEYLAKEHPNPENVYISYFGSNDLDIYEMKQRRLLCDLEQRSLSLFKLGPGMYCISATMLQMVYYQDLVEWHPGLEKEFRKNQKMFKRVINSMGNIEETKKLLEHHGTDDIEECLREYEKLRFAKLADGLRKRKPDGMVNYSILLYSLSAEDLKQLVDE